MKFELGHRPELDGLRGIAILIVVVSHYFGGVNAGLGVDIFFVLSGFLITMLLSEEFEKNQELSLRYFYQRRVLRLLPALGCTILGVYLLSFTDLLIFPTEMIPYILTYTANLPFVFGWVTSNHSANPLGPTWSLAIEEQFYIVWPLVFLGLHRLRKGKSLVRPAIGLFLIWECYRWSIVATTFSVKRLYYSTDCHAQLLLIGCILALIRRESPVQTLSPKSRASWSLAVVLIFFGIFSGLGTFDLYAMLLSCWGIAIAAVVWATTLELGWVNLILKNSVLTYTGKISYGVYLYHIPLKALTRDVFENETYSSLVGFLLTSLAATSSYWLIEKPIMTYRKYPN